MKLEERDMILTASLRELERKTQVDRSLWSRWLNGKSAPNLNTLEGIADKLGMDPDEFIPLFRQRRDRYKSGHASSEDGGG